MRLFGHPVLERDGIRSPIGVPAKGIVLLALVASNASRPLSREWIAQALWPDDEPSDARTNLRRHFHLLARSLDDEPFALTRQTAQWNRSCALSIDVLRFEELAAHAPALALEEYAGELCTGIPDDLLEAPRLRYRSLYEDVLQRLIAHARDARDTSSLLLYLQRQITHDPLDEAAVRELMLLRNAGGDKAGALRDFKALAARLRAEIDVEPQAETTELFQKIASERAPDLPPHNLVQAGTTFVGREAELEKLATMTRSPGIVTLVGAGGVGKSRLALRAALDALPAFPGGAWRVELEYAKDEAAIWSRIAASLAPVVSDSRRSAALQYLREHRSLIILDTCEHVHDGAGNVILQIAGASRGVTIATSRRRLGVAGEQVVEVNALALPPASIAPGDSPLRYAAYRLFLERAAMVSPAFHVETRDVRALGELLHSIDGLPLAIEIVASRANMLTIDGMRKRLALTLRSGHAARPPGRGYAMEETVRWSYDLLSEEQRETFAWLGMFCGGFSVEDVESLCAHLPGAVESLFELVDASLVGAQGDGGDIRYRLLETARLFARSRLEEHGSLERAQRAHAEHTLKTSAALTAVRASEFATVLDAVLGAMPDYLAALDNAARYGWGDLGLSLLERLRAVGTRRYFSDELFGCAIALFDAPGLEAERQARLHAMAGHLAEISTNLPRAVAEYEIAAAQYRSLENAAGLADTLTGLAVIAFNRCEFDRSRAFLEEVHAIASETRDERLLATTIARLACIEPDPDRAIVLFADAVQRLRVLDEPRQLATALRNLANQGYVHRRYADAIRWVQEALEIADGTGDAAMHAVCLSIRAAAERDIGDTKAALRSHLAACAGLPSLPGGGDVSDCLEEAAITLDQLGESEAAARIFAFCERHRRATDYPRQPLPQHAYDAVIARLRTQWPAYFSLEQPRAARDRLDDAAALAVETLTAVLHRPVPLAPVGEVGTASA